MNRLLPINEHEQDFSLFDQTVFNALVSEENEQWISCISSFAFVAIQRFIAHCKNNNLDPLEMRFEDIQKFMETCLKKELFHEMKN